VLIAKPASSKNSTANIGFETDVGSEHAETFRRKFIKTHAA
jgi:hypothetical protein